MSTLAMLAQKTIVDSEGCWIWLGKRNHNGYGVAWIVGGGGREALAHRLAYVETYGEVPEGHELDHLCRARACINPAHLEPVPHAENVRRGVAGEVNRARQLARTHCARGHEWTPENTKQTPRQRKCRACIRIDSANARLRRNAS